MLLETLERRFLGGVSEDFSCQDAGALANIMKRGPVFSVVSESCSHVIKISDVFSRLHDTLPIPDNLEARSSSCVELIKLWSLFDVALVGLNIYRSESKPQEMMTTRSCALRHRSSQYHARSCGDRLSLAQEDLLQSPTRLG